MLWLDWGTMHAAVGLQLHATHFSHDVAYLDAMMPSTMHMHAATGNLTVPGTPCWLQQVQCLFICTALQVHMVLSLVCIGLAHV